MTNLSGMTKEEAVRHRTETFDLCRQLDELVAESATWAGDDAARAKDLQRKIYERVSQNPMVYPGLSASLDEEGNLTRSITIFTRGPG